MERLISRLDKALNQQKSITVVFDIDSTIFDVTPRNQEILNLFLSKDKSLNFEHKLKSKEWGIETFLDKDWSVKYKNDAKSFWRRHFFSGTFLNSDAPYPHAINFIQSLKNIGAEVLYLTGRDTQRMRSGSLKQLKNWQLPLEQDEDLFTKPHKGMPDGPYKALFLEKILNERPENEVYFFDNEPVVLDHCTFDEKSNFQAFFIDSTHSNRMQPKKDWLKLSLEDYEPLCESLKGYIK